LNNDSGVKTDSFEIFEVGVPRDIGWARATVHEDQTVTRTCKGCGVSHRSVIQTGRFVSAAFIHRKDCAVLAAIERSGGWVAPIS
jgi:hypothetical protein